MDQRHINLRNLVILRRARSAAVAAEADHKRRRVLAFLLLLQLHESQRQWWVHPVNDAREEEGEFYVHYLTLRNWRKDFFTMYRMYPTKFDQLLRLLEPRLRKKNTNMREALSPELKLVLTLT